MTLLSKDTGWLHGLRNTNLPFAYKELSFKDRPTLKGCKKAFQVKGNWKQTDSYLNI